MRRPLGLAGAGARWPWGSWWPSSPCAGGAVDSTVLSLSWEHGGRPQCSFLLIQRPGGGIRGTPAPRIRALREMWSFMCIISGCFSLWVSVNAWSSVTWFLSLSFPCQFSGLPLPPTFNYVFFCSGFFSPHFHFSYFLLLSRQKAELNYLAICDLSGAFLDFHFISVHSFFITMMV